MRNSKILAKLRNNQPARIAMLGHFFPPFIAYAADAGFDGIWLDCEHRAWDDREIPAALAYFHLYDIDCLVRPATREKAPLYRYLEDGAAGLVVPHVSTPDEARDLVHKVKFPPMGDRGVNGVALESNFGLDVPGDRTPLVEHALKETFLIVQIETPDALANVDEIAGVPGVDGLYIGPADLRIRMNQLPADQQVNFDETLRRVAVAADAHDIVWGTFPATVEAVRQQAQLGAKLLVWGIDVALIAGGIKQASTDLDAVINGS